MLKKSLSAIVQSLVVCLPFSMVAPALADPIVVKTEQATLTIPQKPQRLAVFDLAVVDNLNTLGIDVAGVPKRLLPKHLAAYSADRYTSIGSLFEPDYDRLGQLAPDLIVVGMRSQSAAGQLGELAPVLDLSQRSDHFVEPLRRQLRILGQIFDREAVAEQKIAAMDQALSAIREQLAGQTGLVLFAYNGELIPHAPGERFGMFHELTGMNSVAERATAASGVLPKIGTPEATKLHRLRLTEALAAKPDWLIVLDRSAVKGAVSRIEEQLQEHPAITASSAWQKGQVYYLDAPAWYLATGGYQSVMKTLEGLQRLAQQFPSAVR